MKTAMVRKRYSAFFLMIFLLAGCNPFMYGLTEDKAMNKYLLVTGDKDNFGDRRIKYNQGLYKHSALDKFLGCKCMGRPSFIYEYKTQNKIRGIKLFYVPNDSVFVFEELRKGNLVTYLKETRKINESEHAIYNQLKDGN